MAATITLARQRQRSSRDTPSSDGEPSPAQPSSLAGEQTRLDLPEDVQAALANAQPATRQGTVPRLYYLAFDANPAVRVTTGGGDVPIRAYEGFSTRSSGGHSGRAIGTFRIDEPGRFLLVAAGEPQAPQANVAVGQEGAGLFLLLTVFGAGILGMAGVVLGIIVLWVRGQARQMRHSPTRQPATWEQGAVPGWYRDPGGRHELRYWDGLRWTEHVFDRGTQAVDPIVDSRSSERTPKAT